MDPLEIIGRFCPPGTQAYDILRGHGEQVAQKALQAADAVAERSPDRAFIRESAMLHDIGVLLTDTPSLGCFGNHPYVCHGVLGRMLLEKLGLFRHALVCERHVGVGLGVEDIRNQRLPLPLRDMRPRALEEVIVCYADKFFSKNNWREKSAAEILHGLKHYGMETARRFSAWMEMFER